MTRTGTLRVWSNIRQHGRCKHCHRSIVWATRPETGKMLPLDPGATVREVVTDPDKRVHYDLIAWSDVHDCAERREAQPRRAPTARLF